MVTLTALSADELSAISDRAPIFAGRNHVRSVTDLRWSTGGEIGSTDTTDSNFPIGALHDGRATAPSKPSGLATTHYITGTLPANSTVDTLVVEGLSLPSAASVTLELSETDDFSGAELFTSRSTLQSATRFAWWGLDQSGTLYRATQTTNPIRFRVTIGLAVGGFPEIGEVFLGQFRLFSRPWGADTGFDDAPQGTEFDEFQSVDRDRIRYVRASGYADSNHMTHLFGTVDGTAQDRFGWDDVATHRLLREDIANGSGSVWYRGASDADTRLVVIEDGNMDLPIPPDEATTRVWDVSLRELPPFAANYTAATLDAAGALFTGGALYTNAGTAELTALEGAIIDARGFQYVWAGNDAVSGSAWVDRISNYSVPWASVSGSTITGSQDTTGFADVAIGPAIKNNAVRITNTGTGHLWSTSLSGDASLSAASGQSLWARLIEQQISPTINNANPHHWFEFRDTVFVSGADVFRCLRFNTTGGQGGASGSIFNGSGTPQTQSITPTTDQRGTVSLIDIFADGSTGNITVCVNGTTGTTSGTGSVFPVDQPYIQLSNGAQSTVCAICFARGSAADGFSTSIHSTDFGTLTS